MQFIAIPTEQTTAITDFIVGGEAVILIVYLHRFSLRDRWKVRLWQTLLAFTAVVAFAGAYVHGIVMPRETYELLWKPINLLLGFLVANFVLAAVYDLFGLKVVKRLLPILCAVAVGFFAVTQIKTGTFLMFVLYEIAAMLFALGSYGTLAWRRTLPGAGIIAFGIVLQIVAAAVQASGPWSVRIIWEFDHNGVFHLIGMLATVIMVVGVARSLHLSGGGEKQ